MYFHCIVLSSFSITLSVVQWAPGLSSQVYAQSGTPQIPLKLRKCKGRALVLRNEASLSFLHTVALPGLPPSEFWHPRFLYNDWNGLKPIRYEIRFPMWQPQSKSCFP